MGAIGLQHIRTRLKFAPLHFFATVTNPANLYLQDINTGSEKNKDGNKKTQPYFTCGVFVSKQNRRSNQGDTREEKQR